MLTTVIISIKFSGFYLLKNLSVLIFKNIHEALSILFFYKSVIYLQVHETKFCHTVII